MAERSPQAVNRRLWLFTGTLAGVAAIGAALGWHVGLTAISWPVVGFFLLLNLAIEAFPVHLPFNADKGTLSASSACYLAEIVLFPPVIAGLLAMVGSFRLRDVRGQTPPRALIFNRAQVFLGVFVAALVFHLTGGTLARTGLSVVSDIAPLVLAGVVFALLNLSITSRYLSWWLGKSLRTIWRVDLSFAWANYLGDILLGLLIAAAYVGLGVIGPVLFFGPLLFSRWTMERFVQLREAYLDVVATLVNALDAKDSYTFGHSQRVAEGTIALGEYLKLSDKDMDTLYFSSILHDVGKIAIPDEILNKAGAFVLREYLIMQQHAPIGERILSHLRFLGPGVRWVGAHHERWDGQGFPDRIGGEEIPYGARLISVVDTYDAMTSDRPYRKGAEPAIAHQEIARAAGTQFDPKVAKAFLEMEKAELSDQLRAHLDQEIDKVEQVS